MFPTGWALPNIALDKIKDVARIDPGDPNVHDIPSVPVMVGSRGAYLGEREIAGMERTGWEGPVREIRGAGIAQVSSLAVRRRR